MRKSSLFATVAFVLLAGTGAVAQTYQFGAFWEIEHGPFVERLGVGAGPEIAGRVMTTWANGFIPVNVTILQAGFNEVDVPQTQAYSYTITAPEVESRTILTGGN